MRSLLILLLLAVLSIPTSLFGAEKVVALATFTNFIPFCFNRQPAVEIPGETIPPGSDSRQLQGYSWDVVRESYHAMGYTIRLYVVSQKYRKVGPFEVISEYLMGRKGSPESDLAISAFDRGREQLDAAGTIPAIAEKWL